MRFKSKIKANRGKILLCMVLLGLGLFGYLNSMHEAELKDFTDYNEGFEKGSFELKTFSSIKGEGMVTTGSPELTLPELNSRPVVDVGLDKTKGVKLDMIKEGIIHKVLGIWIEKDISAQEISLILKNSNFNTREIVGKLEKQDNESYQVDVYEDVCTPYYEEELPNGTIPYYPNCSKVFKEKETKTALVWNEITPKGMMATDLANLKFYDILSKGTYRYSFDVPIVKNGGGWGNRGEVQLALDDSIFTDRQSSSWWNLAWKRRVAINITENNATDLSNYQINLTDYGYDSDMNADFSDLRFTNNSNLAELDYWIENFSASNDVTVWIEVPFIPSSGIAAIYMYYKNSGVSTTSNGNDTFRFFEDWVDGDPCLSAGKWEISGVPDVSCSGSIMTYTGGTTNFQSWDLFGLGYAQRFRSRRTISSGTTAMGFRETLVGAHNYAWFWTEIDNITELWAGATTGGAKIWHDDGLWYTYDVAMPVVDTVRGFVNGTNNTIQVKTSEDGVTVPKKTWRSTGAGSEYQEDWMLVRNYTDSGPSVIFGAEEELPVAFPINLNAPSNNTVIGYSTVDFNWTAISDANSTSFPCNLTIDSVKKASQDCTNGTLCNQQVTGLTEGYHYWNVTCNDGSNINSTMNWTVNIELSSATVTLIDPESNWYINDTAIFECRANASSNGLLANISLFHNYTGTWHRNITQLVPIGKFASVKFNFTGLLTESNFIWNCYACSLNGHCNYATANRTLYVDNTRPFIEFAPDTPLNDTSVNGDASVYINITSSDSSNNFSAFLDWNDTLIGWWRLEEENITSFADTSGNSNRGICTTCPNSTIGPRGKAMKFDGIDDYINISGIDVGTESDSLSVSAWIKLNELGFGRIIYNELGNTGFSLALNDSGSVRFMVQKDGTRYLNNKSTALTMVTNKWYHILAVYDGNNHEDSKIYVDGVSVTLGSDNIGLTGDDELNIGRRADGNAQTYINGSIDEVMIFERTFSSQEVNATYNAGLYNLNRTFTGLSDGITYTYKAYAVDQAGNMNETLKRSITIDQESPQVLLNAPANNTNFTTSAIDLNWTASDNLNFTSMTTHVYLDGKINATTTSPNGTLKNIQITGIPDGIHSWYINVTDCSNINTSATWNFTIDTSAPDIFIESPTNKTYSAATTSVGLNVSTTVDDASSWLYNLNAGTNTTFTPNITLSATPGTAYYLLIYLNDSFGNLNVSSLSYFINSYPTLDLNDPANTYNTTFSTMDFNWTVTDAENSSMRCDLYLNGTKNATTLCTSGALCNQQVTGLPPRIDDPWYVNCSDSFDTNQSATRTFSRYRFIAANLSITSSSTLNYSNGSLTFNYDYYNDLGLPEYLYETKWYNNSVEVISFRNLTYIASSNLSWGETWNATARYHDGQVWSDWNVTLITINNVGPTVPTLFNPPDNYNQFNFTINLTCINSTDIDVVDTIYYEFWQNFTNGSAQYLLQNSTALSYLWDLTGNNNITVNWTCRAHDNASSSPYALSRTIFLNTSRIYNIQEAHISPVFEGTTQIFKFNVSSYSGTVSDLNATFIYADASYTTKVQTVGERKLFNRTLTIPQVANQTNITFIWNVKYIDINGSLFNENYTYTDAIYVFNISLDNCSVNSKLILNFTLFDESTKLTSALENASIETDLDLRLYGDFSFNWTFHLTSSGTNLGICISNYTNATNYRIYSTTKYSADVHEIEYHYIQNYELSWADLPNQINLYDLNTTESTSFLVTFKDATYIPVEDAIIDLWRYYVGEGEFISVEHGKTNDDGQTILNFIVEDVIYKFYIRKENVLLWESPQYQVICQTTPCTLNLQQTLDELTTVDYESVENLEYSLLINESNRDVTLTYSTVDGSGVTVSLNVTLLDGYMNKSVCYASETSSGGTLSCQVVLTEENATYYVEFKLNDEFVTYRLMSLARDAYNYFGYTGILMTVILFGTFACMAVSSGVGVIVFSLLGLIVAALLGIFIAGPLAGAGSSFMWLIVAGAILLWKISKRRNQ